VKQSLVTTPILALPIFTEQFVVQTDVLERKWVPQCFSKGI
jgi:hypothetical protein